MSHLAGFHTASNSYAITRVSRNLVPLLALYALAPQLTDLSPGLAWVLTPVIGVLLYRLTMVMHDCGHGTLFTSRRTNVIVGKGLGYITGVDFDRFKERHWEHHRHYGAPRDPQGFHYHGTSALSRSAFAWHVLKPLLGLNVRYVFQESVLAPRNLKKAAITGELIALIGVQSGAALLITDGRHLSLAMIPFVAAVTFGLFLSQLRGMAEHGVRATEKDGAGFARSHSPDRIGQLLLYEVNFNYHEEHHRHPGIPSCRLPALSRASRRGPTRGPRIWSTLTRMAADT